MILSNLEVLKALEDGRLVIDPRPDIQSFDTHTVDLTLDTYLSVPESGSFIVDFSSKGSVAELIQAHCEKFELTDKQPFPLEPQTFVLGQTREKVGLPLPKDGDMCLAARIEGKSSRARFGLLVHFTAPTVHPDFSGKLTLEIINLGPAKINLYPGMKIAQLIVEEVRGIPDPNPSQFQDQNRPSGVQEKK